MDAVTFTSAPAAAGLLNRANEIGVAESLVRRLRTGRPYACCVGPVTAGPLQAQSIPTSWPERGRIGAMVRHLADELPRRTPTVKAAGHELTIQARAVRVDDTVHRLTPRLVRLLGALADRPGQVCDRVELLDALDGESAPHAVETAVARLRVALGDPGIVETVVKRGYRLAVEPPDARSRS
ncbi:winged helix-turn-helix domain-containing protein [Spiractinospora alimapuensis]|uniref:winged helix-turn-helix domain-containing protein n=1 Tax=Spiractinospora alimapuensis TaxID=2820884 RepID=UPI003743CDEB